jgi:predicted adenylyl cyclase CyaB
MTKLINVEIKARTDRADAIETGLRARGARYVGTDHQIDTYFACPSGRLKLREGNIENALIFYRRPDREGPKRSDVELERLQPGHGLRALLATALGVEVVVDKQRAIYFLDNVKLHVDRVEGLGAFVEIEAIDEDGTLGEAHLLAQCRAFMAELGIDESELVAGSYADLVSGAGPA